MYDTDTLLRKIVSIICVSLPAITGQTAIADGIRVDGVFMLGIEINYSLQNGNTEFCMLVSNDGYTGAVHQPVSIWFPSDDERISDIEKITHNFGHFPEEVNLVVHRLEKFEKYSGNLFLYDEGSLPTGDEIPAQLYVAGFSCDAAEYPSGRSYFTPAEIDFRTAAPKGLPAERLMRLQSDVFKIDFARR